jgi:hypothetical protein
MNPTTKGSIAEAVIAAGAVKRGVVVLRPISELAGQATLHLRPASGVNGQRLAIKYAEHHRLTGAIAQLGERLAGSQKVGGSSPPGSIA